jgi:hypothetical protein
MMEFLVGLLFGSFVGMALNRQRKTKVMKFREENR